MSSTIANRLSAAGALLLTLALPASAPAQYQLPTVTSSVKADSLHQAAELLAAAHRWRDAASLHRRSAELRPAEDPLGFRCLSEAAGLINAVGNRSAARGDLARPADHALARGDLRSAALAYLDAAWIAQEQRNTRQVWELGHRAEMLAESPLLGSSDRRRSCSGSSGRRWRCASRRRRRPEPLLENRRRPGDVTRACPLWSVKPCPQSIPFSRLSRPSPLSRRLPPSPPVDRERP